MMLKACRTQKKSNALRKEFHLFSAFLPAFENVMFLKAGNTISLLLFEDKLKQLYHIYTSQVAGGSTESFESLDDDSIIEFLLTVEATVCYNTKKNVVSVDKKTDK